MSKSTSQHISFTSGRRFGIELEVNAFDGESRPPKGKQPEGINHVGAIVASSVPEDGSEIRAYEHTDNNTKWIIKPDASCGIEVCSPPLKGWKGLKKALTVVQVMSEDPQIKVDRRCSVHVHLDVSDLTETQLAKVVSWWVKCEPVFLDAMPLERKRNRYCQSLGMNNIFQHDVQYSDKDIICRVGDIKYYTMNTSNWVRGSRKTIEFRPIEGQGCKEPYLIKNWVRLLIHFVETAINLELPPKYEIPKNEDEKYNLTPWTSLCWLDPEHVLSLLGFNNVPVNIPFQKVPNEYTLSNGMKQTRDWFLARLLKYMSRHQVGGMRYNAYLQLQDILKRFKDQGNEIIPEQHISPAELSLERLYGDDYRF